MDLQVDVTEFLKGNVRLPASKSYSIRAFMIAALGGRSRISNPSDCDDARTAMTAAAQLGARLSRVSPDVWRVAGRTDVKHPPRIHVKESGTVLRFILPLVSLHPHPCRITGEGTLKGRPNRHLVELLRRQGVLIRGTGPEESVPIRISGGALRGGRMEVEGSVSSQFISALMIACPHLPEDTTIVIKGRQVVSADYIEMTGQVLRRAGIKVTRASGRVIRIPGGQKFQGLKKFIIPSDYGLAAFLLAAGALTRSDLTLQGSFQDDLIQADGHILEFLRRMNVPVRRTPAALKVRGPARLKGGRFSLKDCPDLLPVMAVLALFAEGKTRLVDIRHARVKESNRVTDLRRELLKVGAVVGERENELTIIPRPQGYRRDVVLEAYHDHRLAMAWSVLGLKCGVRVKGIECVRKSYPGFVEDFKALGAGISPYRRRRQIK